MVSTRAGAEMREQAEKSGELVDAGYGVHYVVGESRGRVTLTAWKGRASKPLYYHFMEDEADALATIAREVEKAKRNEAEKEERRKEAARNKADMVARINVGTILAHSWGYDQTNVDFYVVTKKRGSAVTVRLIGSREVPGSRFDMTNKVKPDLSVLTDHVFERRIVENGVKINCSVRPAYPVEPDSEHFSSWYA